MFSFIILVKLPVFKAKQVILPQQFPVRYLLLWYFLTLSICGYARSCIVLLSLWFKASEVCHIMAMLSKRYYKERSSVLPTTVEKL